jgi:hypothetical protein
MEKPPALTTEITPQPVAALLQASDSLSHTYIIEERKRKLA